MLGCLSIHGGYSGGFSLELSRLGIGWASLLGGQGVIAEEDQGDAPLLVKYLYYHPSSWVLS